jgi:hypothetical protein
MNGGGERSGETAARRDERVKPSTGTFYVALPALDWGPDRRLVHPPEQVVQVSVINDVTALTVCKYDEDGTTQTCATVVEVVVDTNALLAALVSQLDPDVGQAALSMHRSTMPGQKS